MEEESLDSDIEDAGRHWTGPRKSRRKKSRRLERKRQRQEEPEVTAGAEAPRRRPVPQPPAWVPALDAALFEPRSRGGAQLSLGEAGREADAVERLDRALLALRGPGRGTPLNAEQASTRLHPDSRRRTGAELAKYLLWLSSACSARQPPLLVAARGPKDPTLTAVSGPPFGCGRCSVCVDPRAVDQVREWGAGSVSSGWRERGLSRGAIYESIRFNLMSIFALMKILDRLV